MYKIYAHFVRLACCILFLAPAVNSIAQITVATPVPSSIVYVSDTEPGVVVFGVRNNNTTAINVTQIAAFVQNNTPAGEWKLWYHPTDVTGAPGIVSAANGWIEVTPGNMVSPPATNSVIPVVPGISVTIPAATIYRFAITAPIQAPIYGTAGSTGDIVSAGGVDIFLQGNSLSPTYAGAANAAPTFTPRSFYGSITFEPVDPCGTPVAGDAVASRSFVCPGGTTQLDLINHTLGAGQTYQWQTSSTQAGTYTNIGPSSSSPIYSFAPSATAWYRAQVTCGASIVTSTPVQVSVSAGGLNGTFTIDNGQPTSATNFNSFADVLTALQCGVSGPVVFNVAPGSGPYTQQIVIPQVTGASATNTITFNGNGASIVYTTNQSAQRAAIILNGADHVTIDSFNIDVSAGSHGWGIVLTGTADSNIIRRNTITTAMNSTATNYAGIVINGSATGTASSGNNGNGNLIERNTIRGGYYGVYLYGNSADTDQNLNNQVRSNKIEDIYLYGVYSIYQNGMVVSKNDISRPTRNFSNSITAYGVMLSTGVQGSLVEKNRIHDMFVTMPTTAGTFYGVYVSADAPAGNPNRVVNNLIYNIGGNPTLYGIADVGGDNLGVYHNTVVHNDQSATSGPTYGLYQSTAATGVDFKNNIVYISRSGTGAKRAVWYNTTTSSVSSDSNVLIVVNPGTSDVIGRYGTVDFATLLDWQTANNSAFDQASISADPLFTDPFNADYTPMEPAINNIASPGRADEDILDQARGPLPDPGAYEFDVVGIDGALSWVAPVMPISTGSHTVTVDITNNSSSGNITSVNLTYTDGNAIFVTEQFTGLNLAPAASQSLSFATPVTINGNITLQAYINMVNGSPDISQLNDTAFQTICFPLNGVYTINQSLPGSNTNFTNFNEAIGALVCGGVDGPVVFNVEPFTGPYTGGFTIPEIAGASATNTITFFGNGETISYTASGSGDRSAIILDGADHIILDSFYIDVTGGGSASHGWAIVLTNQADSNVIRRNTIMNDISATSTLYAGIVINGSTTGTASSGNNGNGNLIEKNTINGGYYGVYIYGSSSSSDFNHNNQVRDNVIKDSYLYGVYAIYQTDVIISGNEITRPSRSYTTSPTVYGISISTGVSGALIEKNHIHNMYTAMPSAGGTFYGIHASADGFNRVINNLVHSIGGNPTIYGIGNVGADSLKVYHNTVVLDGTAATTGATYGLYQTTAATGVEFKNNLVYISRSGTGIKSTLFFNTTTSTIESDHNVLVMMSNGGTSNLIGRFGATNYTSLTDWQTNANGGVFDNASVNADPVFTAPGFDYTPTSAAVNNIGTNVGVPEDITGRLRNMSLPDPGAYEFSLLVAGIDLTVEGLVAPEQTDNNCFGMEDVSVRIRNNSSSTIDFATNPATLTVQVSGATTQTLTHVINTGTLESDSLMVITFTPALDMTVAGTYTFNGGISVTGDVNNNNDTLVTRSFIRSALTAGAISVTPAEYCAGSTASPILSSTGANGYGGLQWQSSTTSGSGFTDMAGATTNPFVDATPVTQTRYYRLVATCGTETVTSAEITLAYGDPVITSTTDGSRCGDGTVELSAVSNVGTINWYAAATGGGPIGTGNTFITPPLSSTTTFYAAAAFGGAPQQVGRLAPNVATTLSASPRGIAFNANNAFTLISVDVYPFSAGSGTIEVRDGSGSVVAGPVNVSWPTGNGTVPHTINLNLQIPAGTGMGLLMTSISGNIGYETATNFNGSYPYQSPDGSVAITSSRTSATANSTTTYYYFYNWSVSSGCESPRVAVTANVTAGPAVAVTSDTTICNNGIQMLQVTSNTASFDSYEWTPVANLFTDAAATVPYTGGNATQVYMRTIVPGVYTYLLTAGNSTTQCGGVDSVKVTVMPQPNVTATMEQLCNSGTTSLSLNPATGYGTGSFQWQVSTDGSTYSDITGATGVTYTTPVITQTTYYRVQVKDGAGNVCSQPADTIIVNSPAITGTTPGSRCDAGSVILSATGSAGTTIQWYESATGGTPLHVGPTFTTPPINTTTNYYVSAGVGASSYTVGAPNNGQNTGYTLEAGLFFDVSTNITINGVHVYPVGTGDGDVVIALKDASGANIETTTVSLTGTAAPGVKTYVPLGYNVMPGTGYSLVMLSRSGGVANLVRDGAAAITGGGFPFTIPGVMSITNGRCCPSAVSTSYYYFYDWVVSAGCESDRTMVTATIDNGGAAAGAVGTTECATATIAGGTAFSFTDCDPIAMITPSGASPISGSVDACVTIDASVQTANGEPYAQRHYNITPANNASTATSTITLYYLQSEFNAYNAAAGTYPLLPVNSADAAGRANLRITQYNGTGTAPGNYTGTATLIDPDDASIVWNSTAGRWEVTFAATGSGGFYLHTGNAVLPVTQLNFSGVVSGSINRLMWTTATETNNKGFELQRSADGRNFTGIGFIASKGENGNSSTQLSYSYEDSRPLAGNNYYRLKQVDRDGRTSYSNIVMLNRRVSDITLSSVYPNPTSRELNVVITSPRAERVTLVVTDLSGKIIQQRAMQLMAGDNQELLNVGSLAAGTYLIKAVCANGCETAVQRFVKR